MGEHPVDSREVVGSNPTLTIGRAVMISVPSKAAETRDRLTWIASPLVVGGVLIKRWSKVRFLGYLLVEDHSPGEIRGFSMWF